MTHDELLEKIDINKELTDLLKVGLINGDIAANTARQHLFQNNALRAVVELHHPLYYRHGEVETKGAKCSDCNVEYPCNTIKTIEKELG